MDVPPEVANLKKLLNDAAGRNSESRNSLRRSPPDMLFHYTTPSGLLGILSSNKLWGTNYRFLNDRSEVTYGFAVFEQVVRKRLQSTDNPICRDMLAKLLQTANAFDGMLDFYAACFCGRDDLLHQWRFYAGAGGGYAMGFETKFIGRRWVQTQPNQNFVLTKVIYDPAQQSTLIAEIVDSALRELSSLLTEDSTIESSIFLIAECCRFVRAQTAEYLISFKHPAFEVEHEWRICLTPGFSDELQIRFRVGPYGLTPYVEMDPTPMAGVHRDRLPLASLVHGPVPDPANTRVSLNMLLRSKGYSRVNISGCELPFRIGA